jgi:hypothetical protein
VPHNLKLHCLPIELDRPDFLPFVSTFIEEPEDVLLSGERTKSTPMVEM